MNGHYYRTLASKGLVLFTLLASLLPNVQVSSEAASFVRQVSSASNEDEVTFDIVVRQRSFRLPFQRNRHLASKNVAVTFRDGEFVEDYDYDKDSCEHFTHCAEDNGTVAALSRCHNGNFIRGFVSTRDVAAFDISTSPHQSKLLVTGDKENEEIPVQIVESRLPETVFSGDEILEEDGRSSVERGQNNSMRSGGATFTARPIPRLTESQHFSERQLKKQQQQLLF